MWISRRRFQQALEEAAKGAVDRALAEARLQSRASETQTLTQAIEGLFTKQLESFGKNTEAMGGFLGAIADLSMRRAAVALGSRGGRKRAENAAARKAAVQAPNDCEVCANPMSTNQQAIVRHVSQGHDQRRNAATSATVQAAQEHAAYIRQGQFQLPPPSAPAPAPANGTPGTPGMQSVRGN